jgi:hypothetical protein
MLPFAQAKMVFSTNLWKKKKKEYALVLVP